MQVVDNMRREFLDSLVSSVSKESAAVDDKRKFVLVRGLSAELAGVDAVTDIRVILLEDLSFEAMKSLFQIYLANLFEEEENATLRDLNAVTKSVGFLLGLVEKVSRTIDPPVTANELNAINANEDVNGIHAKWAAFTESFKNLAPVAVSLLFIGGSNYFRTNHTVGGFTGNMTTALKASVSGLGVSMNRRLVYELIHFASKRNLTAMLMASNGKPKPVISNHGSNLTIARPYLSNFEKTRASGMPSGQAVLGLCNQFMSDLSTCSLILHYPKAETLLRARQKYLKVLRNPLIYHVGFSYLYALETEDARNTYNNVVISEGLTPGSAKSEFSLLLGDMNEFYSRLYSNHSMLNSPMVRNAECGPGRWRAIILAFREALREVNIQGIDFDELISSGGNFELFNKASERLEEALAGEEQEEMDEA